MTVRRYLPAGGWLAHRGRGRPRTLARHEDWVAERFRRHARQCRCGSPGAGAREGHHGCRCARSSGRWRLCGGNWSAEARATIRFETPPGKQLQIDFGERRVSIGGETVKVYLFVATLGYSRRLYVHPFRHERQEAGLPGRGRVPALWRRSARSAARQCRGLVEHHDAADARGSSSMPGCMRLPALGFPPRACAPYRARTKGKDERGVGYVKKNAIAGPRFASWAALEAHLDGWMRDIADLRVHGTTGEAPIERFRREEAAALRSLAGIPPFRRRANWCARCKPTA